MQNLPDWAPWRKHTPFAQTEIVKASNAESLRIFRDEAAGWAVKASFGTFVAFATGVAFVPDASADLGSLLIKAAFCVFLGTVINFGIQSNAFNHRLFKLVWKRLPRRRRIAHILAQVLFWSLTILYFIFVSIWAVSLIEDIARQVI